MTDNVSLEKIVKHYLEVLEKLQKSGDWRLFHDAGNGGIGICSCGCPFRMTDIFPDDSKIWDEDNPRPINDFKCPYCGKKDKYFWIKSELIDIFYVRGNNPKEIIENIKKEDNKFGLNKSKKLIDMYNSKDRKKYER